MSRQSIKLPVDSSNITNKKRKSLILSKFKKNYLDQERIQLLQNRCQEQKLSTTKQYDYNEQKLRKIAVDNYISGQMTMNQLLNSLNFPQLTFLNNQSIKISDRFKLQKAFLAQQNIKTAQKQEEIASNFNVIRTFIKKKIKFKKEIKNDLEKRSPFILIDPKECKFQSSINFATNEKISKIQNHDLLSNITNQKYYDKQSPKKQSQTKSIRLLREGTPKNNVTETQQIADKIKKHGTEMYLTYFSDHANQLFKEIQQEGQQPKPQKISRTNSPIKQFRIRNNLLSPSNSSQSLSQKKEENLLERYLTTMPNYSEVLKKVIRNKNLDKCLNQLELDKFHDDDKKTSKNTNTINNNNVNLKSIITRNILNSKKTSGGYFMIKRNNPANFSDLQQSSDNFEKDDCTIERLYSDSLRIQKQILSKQKAGIGKRIKQFYGLDVLNQKIQEANQRILSGSCQI